MREYPADLRKLLFWLLYVVLVEFVLVIHGRAFVSVYGLASGERKSVDVKMAL